MVLARVAAPATRICVARRRDQEALAEHAAELLAIQNELDALMAEPATWLALDDGHEVHRWPTAEAIEKLLDAWSLPWGSDRLTGDPTHRVRFSAIAGGTAIAELATAIDTSASPGDSPTAVTLFVEARLASTPDDCERALIALVTRLRADWGIVEPPGWPLRAAAGKMMHAAGALTFVANHRRVRLDNLGVRSASLGEGTVIRIDRDDHGWQRSTIDDLSRTLALGAYPRPVVEPSTITPAATTVDSPWVEPSASALEPPPSVDSTMTLEEYASFYAECSASPHTERDVWLRFGITTAEAKERLDRSFQQRFAMDPQLHGTFCGLFYRYREWLMNRRAV